MARETPVFCEPKVVELYPKGAEPFANDAVLLAILPMLAPCCDAYSARIDDLPGHAFQMVPVIRPDWIGSCLHVLGFGGAEREEIPDVELSVAPCLRVFYAFRDRAIVNLVVGGRGIEHDEHTRRKRLVPTTREPVAILFAIADECFAFHCWVRLNEERPKRRKR